MSSYMQRSFSNLFNSKIGFESALLVTSAHSGIYYPNFFLDNLCSDLKLCRSMEDMYVNDLLEGIQDKSITFLRSHISRSVIDLNRKHSEIDLSTINGDFPLETKLSPRVKAGIGLFPNKSIEGDIVFKRKFTAEEILFLIQNYYFPWHSNLEMMISKIWNTMGKVILIDMHSMPDSENLPDFIIGNSYGKTCDNDIFDYLTSSLKKMGYSVGKNDPYAGGFITKNYFDSKKNIQTVQIEINRKLYMNEKTFSKKSGFKDLKSNIFLLLEDFSELLKPIEYKRTIND